MTSEKSLVLVRLVVSRHHHLEIWFCQFRLSLERLSILHVCTYCGRYIERIHVFTPCTELYRTVRQRSANTQARKSNSSINYSLSQVPSIFDLPDQTVTSCMSVWCVWKMVVT